MLFDLIKFNFCTIENDLSAILHYLYIVIEMPGYGRIIHGLLFAFHHFYLGKKVKSGDGGGC